MSTTPESPRILGMLRSEDGIGVVRIEDTFDASATEVWAAVTEPSRLAQWYGKVEGDLRAGGEFHSHVFASGWEGTGRITECDPPRSFSTTSHDPTEPHKQNAHTVTLSPDGDRTTVVYENRGVPIDLLWAYGVGEQIHVEDLGAYLAGRERNPESRWGELEPAYRELAAAMG
jgi:uncharacterized protein YndB with AHSA1/START domain